MGQFCTQEFTIDKFRALVVLCKVVDGLGEAVEPGIGGHQHQEGHGDNLHCAGGETLLRWTDWKISPPGAKLPLLRDGQLPPLQALLLLRGLLLGEALARGVHLGSHLLQGCRQRLEGCVALSMVESLLRYFLRWSRRLFVKKARLDLPILHISLISPSASSYLISTKRKKGNKEETRMSLTVGRLRLRHVKTEHRSIGHH